MISPTFVIYSVPRSALCIYVRVQGPRWQIPGGNRYRVDDIAEKRVEVDFSLKTDPVGSKSAVAVKYGRDDGAEAPCLEVVIKGRATAFQEFPLDQVQYSLKLKIGYRMFVSSTFLQYVLSYIQGRVHS